MSIAVAAALAGVSCGLSVGDSTGSDASAGAQHDAAVHVDAVALDAANAIEVEASGPDGETADEGVPDSPAGDAGTHDASPDAPLPCGGKCDAGCCSSAGVCLSSCASDPAGSACLPSGSCGCKSNTECQDGQACSGGVCTVLCSMASLCKNGCCSTTGVCVSDCGDDPNGGQCIGGLCGCNGSGDCANLEACDGTTHQCTTSCSASQSCNNGCCSSAGRCNDGCGDDPAGHSCQNNVCGCGDEGDCDQYQACDGKTHTCTTSCSSQSPCNDGCCSSAASCVQGCSADPAGHTCNDNNVCGCYSNGDCPDGGTCHSSNQTCL